jgi:branched-chain amino acid aminotransferase
MEPKVYVDGKLYPKSEAKVSVFDHGLLYGDGIFEGIRVYSGRIFRFKEHMDRLFESARIIQLNMPLSREELDRTVEDTVRANGMRDAYIRLVITRGTGDLGIDPRKCKKSTLIIIVDKITVYDDELYGQGIPIITSSTRRIRPDMLDQRAKSLNYLNSIMAKMEANLAGVGEALMLDCNGYVAECSVDNFFLIKAGELLTPSLEFPILAGITRAVVLDIAEKLDIPCRECSLTLHDVYSADECFLTGTGAELMPVTSVDSRKIGDGKPGPLTAELLKEFRTLQSAEGVDLFA